MYRLIFVDMILTIADAPAAVTSLPANELRLVRTGTQVVDGVERHYYAAEPPLRLLIVMRNGGPLNRVQRGSYLKALVGWDDGSAYVLPGDEGKQHTKISVDMVLDSDLVRPDFTLDIGETRVAIEAATPFSTIVMRAPRSDHPGGWRTDMPGRPPVVAGDPVEAHNITLPSQLWRRVERAGGGNRSAGVRKLIEGGSMHAYEVGKPYIVGRQNWPEFGEYNFRGGERDSGCSGAIPARRRSPTWPAAGLSSACSSRAT